MINLREWALPVYTIMMQVAAGGMLMLWVVYTLTARRHGKITADRLSQNLVMVIFITIMIAMIGSHFHLSRPLYSLLAVRNVKTSWLSREIVFTIAFAVLVGVLWLLQHRQAGSLKLHLVTGWGAVVMGFMTIWCMSCVYLLPAQIAWNSVATPVAFFSATFLLGGVAISALLLMNLYLATLRDAADPELDRHRFIVKRLLAAATVLAVGAALVELGNYGFQIRSLADGDAAARASLDLLLGLYSVLFAIRLGLLSVGVVILVGVVLWQHNAGLPLARLLMSVYVTFMLLLVGEVLGRFLFYAIHVRTGI
ncbi:MAG: dimethyl sulfoxide reductase anchor subunit [Chloroflexi bacterium]|nr:dimethyl sulfoxide reductase anchor subunit [Chloroflexota bacterium]